MTKRSFLTKAVLLFTLTGIIIASIPFFMSMYPPQFKLDIEYKKYNSSLIIDVSELEEGKLLTVEWQGAPIGIYKRSKLDIATLIASRFLVYDPFSKKQSLPSWWQKMSTNKLSVKTLSQRGNPDSRSIKDEYFVFNRVSPVYGCMVNYVSRQDAKNNGFSKGWPGGFFDPCQNIRFDLSGRVYLGRSNGKHLLIPPYRYIDNNTIELYPNG